MSSRRVPPKEAHRLVKKEGYTFVDVRTEEEYADGHPARAANVPYLIQTRKGRVSNADFMPVMEAAYPKSTPLLLGSQSGERAGRAADMLRAAGYSQVVELIGGYAGGDREDEPGWLGEKLPIETISEGLTYPDLRWKAGLV
jgi:rhodanese-related sulfurtransferase